MNLSFSSSDCVSHASPRIPSGTADLCCRLRRLGNELGSTYRRPFLILYLYAVLLNLPLITQRLTNDLDGLWNQDDYLSGAWELSLGRWFIPVLDRLRFDISLDPLPALVSLAFYVLAFLLILDALGLSFRPLTCIMGFLFLSSVGITCQLSLSFTSISYAFSFLLAVLAPWIPAHALRLCRATSGSDPDGPGILFSPRCVLAAALCICLMMGIYQAGIGSTCLLSLFLLLYSLAREAAEGGNATADPRLPQKEKGQRKRLSFVLQMLASVVLGGALYLAIMKVSLRITGTTASDYQGLSDISPRHLLEQLPAAAAHGYAAVRHYFLDGTFCSNRLIGSRAVPILYLLLLPGVLRALSCILRPRSARAVARGLFFVAGILLSPLAANCFYFAAPDTETHMQMTVSMGLLLPLLLGLSARPVRPSEKVPAVSAAAQSLRGLFRAAKGSFSCRRLCTGLAVLGSVVILYGSALQCITDQYAMLVGRRATQTLAEGILTQASLQGYDLLNGQLLITDSPHSSRTFRTAALYDKANSYAQYGNWSHDLSFSRVSWRSFFSNYLRTEVSFAAGDTEAAIAALPEVAAMPSYPAAGSVQNIYGVLVVKLGE